MVNVWGPREPRRFLIAPSLTVGAMGVAARTALNGRSFSSFARELDSGWGLKMIRGAGGMKPQKQNCWEVVRSLRVPEDLALLKQALPAARQSLHQIRHNHHQLARLLATGTNQNECSLITGYSPAYISVLKTDPTFQELMGYYAAQQEARHIDVLDRMKSLGLSTLDELQKRLEEDPDSYSLRELMEQAELLIIKPMTATRSAIPLSSTPSGGINIGIKFVTAETSGAVIDVTPATPDKLPEPAKGN